MEIIGGIIIIWILGKTMEKIGDWLDFEYPAILNKRHKSKVGNYLYSHPESLLGLQVKNRKLLVKKAIAFADDTIEYVRQQNKNKKCTDEINYKQLWRKIIKDYINEHLYEYI